MSAITLPVHKTCSLAHFDGRNVEYMEYKPGRLTVVFRSGYSQVFNSNDVEQAYQKIQDDMEAEQQLEQQFEEVATRVLRPCGPGFIAPDATHG